MVALLGIVVIVLLALIGLLHLLDQMDRRRPGDLRRDDPDPFVRIPTPDRLTPRPVVVMRPGPDGVFRAS